MASAPSLPRHGAAEPSVDGQLLYAIGDVHGCYLLLRSLLAQIVADAGGRARGRRPIILLLGDLIDRGPHAAQVVEAANWLLRLPTFEVRLLMGNHERAMLDFIERPAESSEWLLFGGDATLRCYGIEPPAPEAGTRACLAARDALLQRMPATHLLTLQRALPMVTLGDYAFVHAGIRPGTPLSDQGEDDLLWIGSEFTASSERFEKRVVHGHSIVDEPEILTNRIGIDTGAYRTGRLTALRIDDREIGFLQTGNGNAPVIAA